MPVETHVTGRKWTMKTREELSKSWSVAPAMYDMHTLQIDGHPVMEDWEAGYMSKLAEIACTRGAQHILEIGYGLGLSARAIQQHPGVVTHTVIECHPEVLAKCRNNFSTEIINGRLRLLSGFWQDVAKTLDDCSFDGILYDTYPLVKEDEEIQPFAFFKEAYRLLKPGGIFTYFSSEEDDFTPDHLRALNEAGFFNIQSEMCSVNPPADCRYWQAKSILVPIVRKSNDSNAS